MRETTKPASPSWSGWLGLAVCAVAILAAAPILLPAATSPVEPAEDAGRGTAVAVDGRLAGGGGPVRRSFRAQHRERGDRGGIRAP